MREIKFRAWLTHEAYKGRMFEVTNMQKDSLEGWAIFEGKLGEKHWYSDEVILMQYTGLKDENGKEIYEGDIVEGETEDGMHIYGYVGFRDGSFVIIADDMIFYRWVVYDIEVTGNIHENGELCEKK